MFTQEQLSLYFNRIGLNHQPDQDSTAPSLTLLQQIQAHQLTSIPYENLSLHWRPILPYQATDDDAYQSKKKPKFLSPPFGLSTDELFQKLVVDRRGGYCLELNMLLGVILQALGFEIVHLKAKVVFDYEHISERLRREFKGGLTEEEVRELESFEGIDASGWETHQMLLVGIPSSPSSSLSNGSSPVIKKHYLVDVGLAKYSLLDPIELLSEDSEDTTASATQGRGVMGKQFRISRHHRNRIPSVNDNNDYNNYNNYDDTVRWNLSVRMSDNSQIWYPYYTFLEKEASVEELIQVHYYMSRSPTSTSPPVPCATMPLLRLGNDDNISASSVGEIESVGQVSMQAMRLTIQRASDGSGYCPKNEEGGTEVVLAKDEEEQANLFQSYFGIQGYMDGAVLVLAGDDEDQIGADSW